jgi:hypothetical protein
MDMVRKHCEEGSGNQKIAQECVDRTHEMIRSFKKTVQNFVSQKPIRAGGFGVLTIDMQVPPRDNIDRVPLGASSASMYPGYSPADHIYGEAAAEYGMRMAEAKRKGIEVKIDSEGLEYIVGQSSLSAKEQIVAIHNEREEAKARKTSSGSANPTTSEDAEKIEAELMEEVKETGDGVDLFVIDPNPTPVDQLQGASTEIRVKNKANDKVKRRISFQDEQPSSASATDVHKKKKAKTSDALKVAEAKVEPAEVKDDFEEVVEARHREKEEKRRKKQEKKRKRESESSQILHNESANTTDQVIVPADERASQKPKKKKAKKALEVIDTAISSAIEVEEKAEKKKTKTSRIESGDADQAEGEAKRRKKKQKKEAPD